MIAERAKKGRRTRRMEGSILISLLQRATGNTSVLGHGPNFAYHAHASALNLHDDTAPCRLETF
jgi:hypothetical protein